MFVSYHYSTASDNDTFTIFHPNRCGGFSTFNSGMLLSGPMNSKIVETSGSTFNSYKSIRIYSWINV